MDGDFLSHDFIDEFPMDATEPDDSLVQVWKVLLNFVFWTWIVFIYNNGLILYSIWVY